MSSSTRARTHADTQARRHPDHPPAMLVATLDAKGGTGKSTTAIAVGDALARATGWHVRLIDLDPQASTSQWVAPTATTGIVEALDDPTTTGEHVHALRPGFDILAGHDGLADVETTLAAGALAAVVKACAGDGVDVVLIDTRASGPLAPSAQLLRQAVDVADVVLVPFEADATQARALRQVLADIAAYEDHEARPIVQVLIPTRVRKHEQVADAVELMRAVTGRTILPPVRESTAVKRASRGHRLLDDVAASSTVAADYAAAALMLADVLLEVDA